MISIPESLYLRLVDYFDDKSDIGYSEAFTPNEEIKLLTELEKCKKENAASAANESSKELLKWLL